MDAEQLQPLVKQIEEWEREIAELAATIKERKQWVKDGHAMLRKQILNANQGRLEFGDAEEGGEGGE